MRRLWWLTCFVGAVGCQCGTPDGALKVVVKVDPSQKVTCAVLEISDGTSPTPLQTLELDRDDGERIVGIKQGELPSDIVLKARGYISTTGGCATPRDFNGESVPVNATFPKSGIQTVEVTIAPPAVALDADRDGYVAKTQGGTDCRDDDATIHPGAQEACGGSIDMDCNTLAGCSDPACSTALICQRQPDRGKWCPRHCVPPSAAPGSSRSSWSNNRARPGPPPAPGGTTPSYPRCDRAPAKKKYAAPGTERLMAIHTALSLYHDPEGQFPAANGWMDAIENRLATNDLKKGEAEKKLHRPDLPDGQYGYSINAEAAGKYKDDLKPGAALVFESKATTRNASGNPKTDASGASIGIDGKVNPK